MTCTSTTTQFCNVCNIEAMSDDICVCDKCANVYHRKCHKVNIIFTIINVYIGAFVITFLQNFDL